MQENYKYWVAEPFIVTNYFLHVKVDKNTAFVDQFAALRGINKAVKEVEDKEAEDDEKEDGKDGEGKDS